MPNVLPRLSRRRQEQPRVFAQFDLKATVPTSTTTLVPVLCPVVPGDEIAAVLQAVRQMDTINRQTDELARLRDALTEREFSLAVAQADNSELQLRASTTKHHCIMFGDAWIVETTHHRLKGSLPLDREGAALLALPGVTP